MWEAERRGRPAGGLESQRVTPRWVHRFPLCPPCPRRGAGNAATQKCPWVRHKTLNRWMGKQSATSVPRTTKRNELPTHAKTRMDLQGTMLTDQKITWFHFYNILEQINFCYLSHSVCSISLRHPRQTKMLGKGYTSSLYYFLQLHVNLKWSQNKKFMRKNLSIPQLKRLYLGSIREKAALLPRLLF